MVPQTKVFIGSLPQGSKPEDLRKLFERFGVVTECDIMNRCGFVHMQTEDQASAAIRALNNTTFNGGVISVERGRIKERGQRGGGAVGRGGMRGAMRGGMDRRGGMARPAPYMPRDRAAPYMRGAPPATSQMAPRSMGYERTDRPPQTGYDDRYNGYGYGGEDRRGFALMERGAREGYAAPMYEERRYDELPPMYDERRAPMYDERDMMERRIPATYDRPAPARSAPHPNGDMFSRREPMHGGGGAPGYERDPYAQQYPAMGRGGGAAPRGRDMAAGMGPRRY